LAEHWDLPNTGIFYSKDVASVEYSSNRHHTCHCTGQVQTGWVGEGLRLWFEELPKTGQSVSGWADKETTDEDPTFG
jgi:hypothetical protein